MNIGMGTTRASRVTEDALVLGSGAWELNESRFLRQKGKDFCEGAEIDTRGACGPRAKERTRFPMG